MIWVKQKRTLPKNIGNCQLGFVKKKPGRKVNKMSPKSWSNDDLSWYNP